MNRRLRARHGLLPSLDGSGRQEPGLGRVQAFCGGLELTSEQRRALEEAMRRLPDGGLFAAAVVLEVGGPLQHVTSQIRDAQLLEVEGSNGVVRVIPANARAPEAA